ncbi:MAG: hypothetical protein CMO78_07105 [Verrucomicrobiales bacterium]|nr:hypothetical protein [Verrucomicrobiales bacterium]|tara:strand:+ start:713 stop:2032 length:1320 start_codon:yes stop_codon:yes gene_type:complete
MEIGRRDFFKIGGISLGAISPLGLSLPQVLANEEASGGRKQINVIFMFLQGGASHLDMYDMKPNAPVEIRGKYSPARTNVPGLHLSDQLPKLGKCADKFSLIRSMHSFCSKHGEGDVDIMCGSPRDKNLQAPGIGAVLSLQQKQQAPVPPFIHLGDMKHPAHSAPGYGGYLGRAHDPFLIKENPNDSGFSVPTFDTAKEVDVNRLAGRTHLLKSLDRYQEKFERQMEFARVHNAFTEKALGLATSTKAKRAFDLSKEPDKLRDTYGRNNVGQSMLLARRLVEAGVRFVTIQGYKDTGIYAWDHHWGIFPHLEQQLPIYDSAYSALLNDLDDRGMLETTLVITAGEFGRTPKINNNKRGPGRDHWADCFSLTLGGGGIKTGRIIGASDKHGAVPVDRPVSIPDFAATVYHAIGLDPKAEFVAQGRRMQMLPEGSVVRELL